MPAPPPATEMEKCADDLRAGQCFLGHEYRSRAAQCVQIRHQTQHQRVLRNHWWSHCAKNAFLVFCAIEGNGLGVDVSFGFGGENLN